MNTHIKAPRTRLFLGGLAGLTLLSVGWVIGGQAKAQSNPPKPAPTRAETYVPAPSTPPKAPAVPAPEVQARLAGALPPSQFHPRDPGEWQGMKVDLTLQPPCMESAHCGQAMACNRVTNRCGPCSLDSDCGSTEACVLDHCLPADKVTCRSRLDCADDALCVLSGLSADARGNRDMSSSCRSSQLGQAEPRSQANAEALDAQALSPEHPSVYGAQLLEGLRAAQESKDEDTTDN